MKLFNQIKKILAVLKNTYDIVKCDNYSIAEYFRKQGAQIGNDCQIGIRRLSTEPYLVKIGDQVVVGSGVLFLTHTSGWNFRDQIPDLHLFGKIEVGNNCYIGSNAILLPNVKIGNNCIVSAGAVVTKDIPSNSIAAGVPARVIGNMDDFYLKIKDAWQVQKPDGFMSELVPGKIYSRRHINNINQKQENKEILRKHLTKLFWGKEF
jgi:acetyltransferase-like isoleucine patch superfamily enzyme